MFVVESENFIPEIKLLELKFTRKNEGRPQSKSLHKSMELEDLWKMVISCGGGDFRPMEIVAFGIMIFFLIFLRWAQNFCKWGKSPPNGCK